MYATTLFHYALCLCFRIWMKHTIQQSKNDLALSHMSIVQLTGKYKKKS